MITYTLQHIQRANAHKMCTIINAKKGKQFYLLFDMTFLFDCLAENIIPYEQT